ncbi:hypothetical protein QTI24_01490 [Variovorax sp. J22P240]|uniref:helix-turn-helix transcriptional regulator n=1 Tax=Variovorax sp. J22P240 TaxID=3053514 RepID=UPI002576BFC8|nr:hypothetical protein [Variovorax sp. J22P240]MDL9997255.1 hypothetical protein [Variovorax sp. J22P240]
MSTQDNLEAVQRTLAEKLNCTIEADLAKLAGVKPDSVVDWRRRGQGPPYVKLGTTFLYPNPHLAAWLHSRIRGTDADGRSPAIL